VHRCRLTEQARFFQSKELIKTMTFTVVRPVRGPGPTASEYQDKLQRLVRTVAPSIPSAAMDIPYAQEVIRLDLSEFPRTIPGSLDE
jgi:hypothetical protein